MDFKRERIVHKRFYRISNAAPFPARDVGLDLDALSHLLGFLIFFVGLNSMTTKILTVKQRKSIFHALVETQDSGVTVSESKKKVASEYHLTREQLDLIEKEGVDKDWPPLA